MTVNVEHLSALAELVELANPAALLKKEIAGGELTLTVRREHLRRFMVFLLNDANCDFKQLMDICGADYPGRPERFEVVYHLLSLRHNQRVRVKVTTDASTPVESVTEIFPSANWYEREVWDLYGIPFDGHPDLRRILTDYGFEGHPLRKDFPLTGFVEVHYDEAEKRVKYAPVKLRQEYRTFDFASPWEGMTAIQESGGAKDVKPKVIAGEGKS